MIDVKKVAHLARLAISDEEEKLYKGQLSSIFKHFEEIASIDTKNVEPLITPTDTKLVFREDHREVVLTVACDEQRRRVWPQLSDLLQQSQSVHARHLNIAHNRIVIVLPDQLESL